MNRAWLAERRSALVRDLVRDYCRASTVLAVQERRFARDGTISHAIVRALLGEESSKGVLWRLKDTAHHLFGDSGASDAMSGPDNIPDAAAMTPDDAPRAPQKPSATPGSPAARAVALGFRRMMRPAPRKSPAPRPAAPRPGPSRRRSGRAWPANWWTGAWATPFTNA